MELKELVKIFRQNFKLFLIILISIIISGLAFQIWRPVSYKSDLTLNITRQGKQETTEYKYDDFYRLQADERFADTVVRWLGSARVLEDIKNKVTFENNSDVIRIKSRRLSSQFIQVTYTVKKISDAAKIGDTIIETVNRETNELNKLQHQENWFTVIGSDPVVKKNEFPISKVILFSLLAGLFFGFWGILLKYYLE
jgi:capsular polysaccharide biosynthesis protein